MIESKRKENTKIMQLYLHNQIQNILWVLSVATGRYVDWYKCIQSWECHSWYIISEELESKINRRDGTHNNNNQPRNSFINIFFSFVVSLKLRVNPILKSLSNNYLLRKKNGTNTTLACATTIHVTSKSLRFTSRHTSCF